MRPLVVLGTCIGAVVLARGAAAHDTWLLAAEDRITPDTAITLSLTSGMAFPGNESAIDATRVGVARLRLAGHENDLRVGARGAAALALTAVPAKAGLGTLWVELHPRTIELQPSDVREYLAEIGAPADLKARWEASPPPHRWRESYRKHAKTFVVVGTAPDDRSWAEPVGMALELVPDMNPAELKRGDKLTVRLLRSGQPAAGLGVGLVGEGSKESVLRTTDASGHVTFDLVRSGKLLLRATDIRPSTEKDVEWESDFATLTLSVQ